MSRDSTIMSSHEASALSRDRQDPLAPFRDRFYLPEDTIYLDGNSLGLLSREAEATLLGVLNPWKSRGIAGWMGSDPPWFHLAEILGAKAAELVGAEPEEVICSGTTTVNLHALVSTFYRPTEKRRQVLADALNFPSDLYALKGQIKLRGLPVKENLVLVPGRQGIIREEEAAEAMSEEIALALFPSVLYRSGQLLDIPYLTRKAHERGILIGFDCSHSAGVVPHCFDHWQVDFAFWCGYKYLNGGPGSPAFLYVNRKHFQREPLLAGWFGYVKERQFDMLPDFRHAPSAGGWQISTPAVLSTAPLLGSLQLIQEAGLKRIRQKSLALTEYLIQLVDQLLPGSDYPIRVATPRQAERRGGHVALAGDEGMWRLYQAMRARGIVADFRPPNILRLAPVALYNSFHEVWRTVHLLKEIIHRREYDAFPDQRTAIT